MVVENQAKRVRRTPLTFTVPACSFVVAARTKQFQLTERASEQSDFLDTRWRRQPALAAKLTRHKV